MADQTKQLQVFNFLRERARSGVQFKTQDINDAMGWKGQTARTYRSKHFAAYLEKVSPGVFRVIPEFRRVTWAEFQDLVTQVRRPFASYERSTYQHVVIYDFLMPLTREDKLRRALDDLFYQDTLERRIAEIGLDRIAEIVPRYPGDDDLAYTSQIISFIGERISGFSISHVSGRFRTSDILSRAKSAERFMKDETAMPYLIDETTAVVRFIIPCVSSKMKHGSEFNVQEPDEPPHWTEAVKTEVLQIRAIFFELFVEALVPTIRGEKLIWMVETSPMGEKLYELDLIKPISRGAAKDQDDDDEDHEGGDSDETAGR